MTTYVDYSQSPDGWSISSTLKLEDDGRFVYDEVWTDYTSATIGGGAEGRWRRDGEGLVFHAESVEGSMYHPWRAGREMEAVVRGNVLDFGGGVTLRVPPEREVVIPVHNTGAKPLTVVLEPWGTRQVLAPGERTRVVVRGSWGPDGPEVVRGVDEVVVYGWSGSRGDVVPEPKQTMTAAPAPAPAAGADGPSVKPPATPDVPKPVTAEVRHARFEPLTPRPELAALIRRRVEELPASGNPDWLKRVCKENDSIPLHCTQIYLWVLRPDGQVMCIDHESFARRAEPETDPLTAYAVLAWGARTYPELSELLPPPPEGMRQCEPCGGEGWTEAEPPAKGRDICLRCMSLGCYVPGVPR